MHIPFNCIRNVTRQKPITKGIDLFFSSLLLTEIPKFGLSDFAPYSSDVFYCPEATFQNS